MYPELSPETGHASMDIHRLVGALDRTERYPSSEQCRTMSAHVPPDEPPTHGEGESTMLDIAPTPLEGNYRQLDA